MGISHGGESMSQYFYTLISNGGLLTFLYIIPTVFVALYVREYSRTYAARRMGLLVEETTGFFKYFSVAGYIVAVLTGMGWGKSSEVRLSGEKKSKRVLYHLSGSIANMLLALALVLVEAVIFTVMLLLDIDLAGFWDVLLYTLDLVVWTQMIMAVCHLVPVPGFDGYLILKTLFFQKARGNTLLKVEANGKWIFVVMAVSGVGMYYLAEVPTSAIYSMVIFVQEWLVDLVTGGLFTAMGW